MIRASRFRVHSDARPDGVSLRLDGELDIATVPHVSEAVQAAREGGAARIVLDLRGLRFIDSSGLRQLIMLADGAREQSWELALIRPGEPTMGVFRLTGAEQNLPFVDAEPEQR